MIFVDTSIWYAANVPEDPDHAAARRLLLEAGSSLVTMDHVVGELLTLLVSRNQRHVAVRIGEGFFGVNPVAISNGSAGTMSWRRGRCSLRLATSAGALLTA
jgi:predicted nucleic acid-binding protein